MNDKAIMLSPFGSIEQWDQVQPMATALSQSIFVPQLFRGQAGHPNCIMALGIASRLDADVLSVMNALYDVHGKIGFISKFLIACVNASGKFDPIRWKFEGKEGQDSWGARAYAKDRQSGEVLTGTLITISMAKKEGWFGKTGSKWQTMPEQMLRYRSASFWISTYAGEYAMGMRTQEDLQDEIQAPPAEVIETVSAKQIGKPRPTSLDDVVNIAEQEKFVPKTYPDNYDVRGELLQMASNKWPNNFKTVICTMANNLFKPDVGHTLIDTISREHMIGILDDLKQQEV